jgi:hypothetical protein
MFKHFYHTSRIIYNEKSGIKIRILERYGFFNVDNLSYMFSYHSPLTLDHWTHYCLAATQRSLHVYIDGRVTLANEEIKGGLGLDRLKLDFMQSITVSSAKIPFNGRLARLNFWSRALGQEEVEAEAACRGPAPSLLAWGTAELVVGEAVTLGRQEGCPGGEDGDAAAARPFPHLVLGVGGPGNRPEPKG